MIIEGSCAIMGKALLVVVLMLLLPIIVFIERVYLCMILLYCFLLSR